MAPQSSAQIEFAAKTLRATRLFLDVGDEDLAELARNAKAFAVAQGKSIKPPNVHGRQFIIIQSGVAAELRQLSESGRKALIALFGRNDIAGLANITQGGKSPDGPAARLSSLIALTNISATAIPHADLSRILRRDADLANALWRQLAEHADAIGVLLAQNIYRPLETRLALLFSQITELSSVDDWNPIVPVGHVSQSLLADMLGVSREHINRTLTMWERSGLIFQARNGNIIVQNRKRLASLARQNREHSQLAIGDDWLWEIDAHLDCGLNQSAFHLAMEAAKRTPKDARIRHRAVLATARSGSLGKALEQIVEFKLNKEFSNEDIACLEPRLLRDLAYLETPDAPDQEKLKKSAQGYQKAYETCRGYYSGINAAAGFALLGEREQAKKLAIEVADLIAGRIDIGDENPDTYFTAATLGECALIAGDLKKAAGYFRAASVCEDVTAGKKATTRKQLKRLTAAAGIEPAWIDEVAPQAKTLFFSGPLAMKDKDQTGQFNNLVLELDNFLKTHPVEWAYGALASGADIIVAEALLARGVDLNVYLPLPPELFLKHSVTISGGDWRDRFYNCMRHASNVEWYPYASKPGMAAYSFGALVAMGKAISHAHQLETEAVGFFAVPTNRTAYDSLSVSNVDVWKGLDHKFHEVRDVWSPDPPPHAMNEPEDSHYALIIEHAPGKSPVPKSFENVAQRLQDKKAGIQTFLFSNPADALNAANKFLAAASASKARIWLDAGVFATSSEQPISAEAAAEYFITTICLPVTEPGEIYASDTFINAVMASGPSDCRFEYTGFAAVREKRAPCPLYLMC